MKKWVMNEKFKNWPVKTKLTYSFVTIIVIAVILIIAQFACMQAIRGRLVKLYNGPTMNVKYAQELYYPQLDIQRAFNRMVAEGIERRDEMYPQLEETINKNLAIMNEAIAFLEKNLLTQEDRDRVAEINDQ